jgi:hypothetical protein
MKNLNDDFADFTGTENYYRHMMPGHVMTDGIKAMADKYKAHWLTDIVFSWQLKANVRQETFQLWIIKCEKKAAIVTMKTDEGEIPIVKQVIHFTNFPEGELRMYLIDDGTNKVLLLPSEY